MPGLGFLKKKRTRDGHGDHGNPTSPVAASHAQSQNQNQNHSHHQQQASGGGGVGGHSHTLSSGVAHHQQQPSGSQGQSNPHTAASTHNQAQPQLHYHPAAAGTPISPAEAQSQAQAPQPLASNAPGVNNLVNAPQNDGAAHANSSHQGNPDSSSTFTASQSATSLGPPVVPTTSASPGTNPALLQQEQQAARPPPTSPPPPDVVPSNMQVDQQSQQPAAQSAQVVQQQHHGHQSQPSQSTPRITKGKYTLTDFDILRTLGTGSFGRVHLVQSKHNQRFYAIKALKKAQVVKMKQVEHTNDERRMLSDVKHPFLITLWGTFSDVKCLYMVMDFVEGGELFSLLRKSGRFPNPVAKFYAAEVTLALEYMHSKNIIYRDLKPENLLLDRHGHLKITDFGFAKRVPDKTWTLCGTPDYLAPEVVSNKGYNKSVDWWSLGILIYEMLCGYTPFWDSGSPMRIYENILKGKVKYPAYIVPEAQDLLQKLITADLTKRLGNLYGGSADVKSHPWFHEVTWDRLARKDIDAPYTPPVKAGAGDASQFDKYPEETDKYGQNTGTDDFGHLFTEF